MELSERDKYIIQRYEEDEEMMVLLFAQWCVNNDVDAPALYEQAYPHQAKNPALLTAIEQTVPKEESEFISRELIIAVLQTFGNDDLAFEVGQMEIKESDSESE